MVRQEDIDAANDPKNKSKKNGITMERSCTDVLCCLFFFVFIVAMIGVSAFGVKKGDVYRILTPYDSDGNECGKPGQALSNNFQGERDFTGYPVKYYAGLLKAATGGNMNDMYKAVCVTECPTGLPSIDNVDVSSLQRVDCLKNDDFDTCPYKQYNTTQILGLCVPDIKSGLETLGKVAEKMGQADNFTTLLVNATKTWKLIIYMSIAAWIITLIYVFVLQYIAKPILYISVLLLLVLLVGAGGYVWML